MESMISGGVFDFDGADGVALGRRVNRRGSAQFIFSRFEFQRWTADAVGKTDEFYFAAGVGAGFEVELMESAHTIGDMNFDMGRVDRLSISGVNGDVDRTDAESAVNFRNVLRGLAGTANCQKKNTT